MSIFITTPHLIFWCLGGILLVSELLAGMGFALWTGLSAVTVGVIVWLFPLISFPVMCLLFAAFSVLSVYFGCVVLKISGNVKIRKRLNDPHASLVGLRTVITTDIIQGSGRIKVRDTTWPAACERDLPAATRVEVIAVSGLTLIVSQIPPS